MDDRHDTAGTRRVRRRSGPLAAAVLPLVLLLGSGCDAAADEGADVGGEDPLAASSEAAASTPTEDATATAEDAAATDVDRATAFWEALAAGDRVATLALVDPDADSGELSPFGWADTLEVQFDWYEAVGVRWTLDGCVDDAGVVECTATASNDWTEVMGVEPVTGTFVVEVGESGVTRVTEVANSFYRRWSPEVFNPFQAWVRANHPGDAVVMWSAGPDAEEEALELFATNTERFVDAHS